MRKLVFGVVVCLFSAGALAQASLVLEGAWVRTLPPTQPNTAAYLTLENTGTTPIVVRSASASIAGRVEIHTTREVDGMMRMEQLQELTLNPGQRFELAPGGTHLMLLDLQRMPAPGQNIQLCLQLASGEEACTVAPARKAGPASHQHQHH